MKYYHVLIETKNPSEKYYQLDKTDLSKIKDEIILPYLKEAQFIFDGYVLDKAKIKRILIKESACTSTEYADYEDERYPDLPFPANEEDIIEDKKHTTDITSSILNECESQIQEATTKPEATTPNNPKVPMDKSKVFIVHGHDEVARLKVANFIKSLGLKDIVLHEQASSGNTIIEKIEANSNVGFGIVLYTPCDLGRSKEEEDQLKPRARQNVVFEHGYLMAKIGRKNVCALVKGDVETPNDISGVVYIKMDQGDGWMLAVAREMKACGYNVDLNKI